jgi:hypothetical protein
MFMDDTTLSEVINISDHLGGISRQGGTVCKRRRNGTKL